MERTKYHRTYHLPWSHPHSDDKALSTTAMLEGEDVVVLEKLDGESTTIYSDAYLHARSLDSAHNMTRDWVKRMASVLACDIPKGWRFVFENVHYYHSIHYQSLEGFAYLLSIWNDCNERIAYDDMKEYAEVLDLPTPKELYRGKFDEDVLRKIANELDLTKTEGYVVTVTKAVPMKDVTKSIAKFVRKNHCQPNKEGKVEHWLKNTYPNVIDKTKPVKPYYMGQS